MRSFSWAATLLACALCGAAAAQPVADPPDRGQVQAAMAEIARDPDLGGKTKEKTLRFKRTDREPERAEPSRGDGWERFMENLAKFLRYALWIAGAVLLAIVLVRLHRWWRERDTQAALRAAVPSHVQSLDIRPESLPRAVGEAAAALWLRGEHRAALSLLYRGALSRLIHVHRVPIRSASTEGECLALARDRIDGPLGELLRRLVGTWQLAVYGARLPGEPQVLALCRDFDQRFGTAPEAGAA